MIWFWNNQTLSLIYFTKSRLPLHRHIVLPYSNFPVGVLEIFFPYNLIVVSESLGEGRR
jgi:hypothetical protein